MILVINLSEIKLPLWETVEINYYNLLHKTQKQLNLHLFA